jgi:hypothetical protein
MAVLASLYVWRGEEGCDGHKDKRGAVERRGDYTLISMGFVGGCDGRVCVSGWMKGERRVPD